MSSGRREEKRLRYDAYSYLWGGSRKKPSFRASFSREVSRTRKRISCFICGGDGPTEKGNATICAHERRRGKRFLLSEISHKEKIPLQKKNLRDKEGKIGHISSKRGKKKRQEKIATRKRRRAFFYFPRNFGGAPKIQEKERGDLP